jgi:hypothetical protein
MSENWDEILGRHIESARQEGRLSGHPRFGKPLEMERANPFAPASERLAHKLLQDAGYSLPWIEDGKVIEADLTQARRNLARAWYWATEDRQEGRPEALIATRWEQAEETFRRRVAGVNIDISRYNLRAPAALHKLHVDIESEVRQVRATGPVK